ncbi:MAG: hypothetical protein E7425_13105 [Ruminococcaceae bacterium]|nr:hypothetical protein [Oscillospiraceae bacterium]
MELFRDLYFKLFAATADAIELLEAGNVWEAKRLLIRAEQETEERYMEHEVPAEGSEQSV